MQKLNRSFIDLKTIKGKRPMFRAEILVIEREKPEAKKRPKIYFYGFLKFIYILGGWWLGFSSILCMQGKNYTTEPHPQPSRVCSSKKKNSEQGDHIRLTGHQTTRHRCTHFILLYTIPLLPKRYCPNCCQM